MFFLLNIIFNMLFFYYLKLASFFLYFQFFAYFVLSFSVQFILLTPVRSRRTVRKITIVCLQHTHRTDPPRNNNSATIEVKTKGTIRRKWSGVCWQKLNIIIRSREMKTLWKGPFGREHMTGCKKAEITKRLFLLAEWVDYWLTWNVCDIDTEIRRWSECDFSTEFISKKVPILGIGIGHTLEYLAFCTMILR